ncbi:MAG: hypothetical protein LBU34_15280 [Planctomycetaceae bacterium]|nr:hypothetical protein [Planctomycetaceae bacterium]
MHHGNQNVIETARIEGEAAGLKEGIEKGIELGKARQQAEVARISNNVVLITQLSPK